MNFQKVRELRHREATLLQRARRIIGQIGTTDCGCHHLTPYQLAKKWLEDFEALEKDKKEA